MQNDRTLRIISRALGTTGLAAALLFGTVGCHHDSANSGPDPADANLAPANGQTQVMGENASYAPQQQGEAYPEGQQAPAPIVQGTPNAGQSYPGGYGPDDAAEQAGEEAIEQTNEAPPPLPEYDQPPCPGPDYLWTPGYWAWGPGGYYWVPGAWVEAPYYGALWTPPYWGWGNGYYRFYPGYWGPHVGYYGGIDYGFGYIGIGYFGGYWSGNNFYYNRAVTRVGGGIHNYYDRPVVYNNHRYDAQPSNRVSYNGGRGGINARPNASELAAGRERHVAALPAQRQLRTAAAQNPSQSFAQNHGRPSTAVEARGVANARGIAPTPRGVEPGRAGVQPGRPGATAGRTSAAPGRPNAASNAAGRAPERGVTAARPGQAPRANSQATRVNPTERNTPAQRGAQPAQRNAENRAAPVTRSAPQAQPRVENRAAPQQRVQPRAQSRPAPQQRAPAPRAQSRPAPQQRAPAPRAQSRPAPQARGGARPAGGHPDEHH